LEESVLRQKDFAGCPICEEFFLVEVLGIEEEIDLDDLVLYVNSRHEMRCTDEEVNEKFLERLEMLNLQMNVLPDSTLDWVKSYFRAKTSSKLNPPHLLDKLAPCALECPACKPH
jgi:hypothetical protein